jgi:hypothetical protein
MTTYSAWDLADHVAAKLAAAGYSLHARKAESDNTCSLGEGEVFWFAWTDGRCDVEVGEDRDNELAAWADALDHHLSNATILTEANVPIVDTALELLQLHVCDELRDLSRGEFVALVTKAEAKTPVQNITTMAGNSSGSTGYDGGHGDAGLPSAPQ